MRRVPVTDWWPNRLTSLIFPAPYDALSHPSMQTRPPDSCGRVLFADDDRAAREGLAEMLRRLGYTCECAATAAEALEKLRVAPCEALISDIHMPGNTALELVEAAVQAVPGLPVILLTGRPSVETAARSVRLPVTAYLLSERSQ